jgi:hypothetical protein
VCALLQLVRWVLPHVLLYASLTRGHPSGRSHRRKWVICMYVCMYVCMYAWI